MKKTFCDICGAVMEGLDNRGRFYITDVCEIVKTINKDLCFKCFEEKLKLANLSV